MKALKRITQTSVTNFIARLRGAAYREVTLTHQADEERVFIPKAAYDHRVLIEAQGPLMTWNNVMDEVDYPEFSYSSPALTAWYVREFCERNHLTGGRP